jgi:hypothetical protein
VRAVRPGDRVGDLPVESDRLTGRDAGPDPGLVTGPAVACPNTLDLITPRLNDVAPVRGHPLFPQRLHRRLELPTGNACSPMVRRASNSCSSPPPRNSTSRATPPPRGAGPTHVDPVPTTSGLQPLLDGHNLEPIRAYRAY